MQRENAMKTYSTVTLAMLAGVALGAGAVQVLHAQAKPQVYYVAELEVTNPEAYAKEYVPKVQALVKASGAKLLAAANNPKAVAGDPPKRVAIQLWDSMDKLMAMQNSAEYKELRAIGDKYSKLRSYAVEALP
jgi:uncharacterized protein (DUF1330 family)